MTKLWDHLPRQDQEEAENGFHLLPSILEPHNQPLVTSQITELLVAEGIPANVAPLVVRQAIVEGVITSWVRANPSSMVEHQNGFVRAPEPAGDQS